MKNYILAFFILFINVSCSQDNQKNKVIFENELTYIYSPYDDFSLTSLMYVSNKTPNFFLINDLFYSKDFLHFKGLISEYDLNENKEIIYKELFFKKDYLYLIRNIVKTDKKEVIEGFKCDKYILELDNQIFEVFITKSKINNIEHLDFLFLISEDNFIFDSGLIVKINVFDSMEAEPRAFMKLDKIGKSKKSIIVDFEKLDLKYHNKLKIDDDSFDIESKVTEKEQD